MAKRQSIDGLPRIKTDDIIILECGEHSLHAVRLNGNLAVLGTSLKPLGINHGHLAQLEDGLKAKVNIRGRPRVAVQPAGITALQAVASEPVKPILELLSPREELAAQAETPKPTPDTPEQPAALELSVLPKGIEPLPRTRPARRQPPTKSPILINETELDPSEKARITALVSDHERFQPQIEWVQYYAMFHRVIKFHERQVEGGGVGLFIDALSLWEALGSRGAPSQSERAAFLSWVGYRISKLEMREGIEFVKEAPAPGERGQRILLTVHTAISFLRETNYDFSKELRYCLELMWKGMDQLGGALVPLAGSEAAIAVAAAPAAPDPSVGRPVSARPMPARPAPAEPRRRGRPRGTGRFDLTERLIESNEHLIGRLLDADRDAVNRRLDLLELRMMGLEKKLDQLLEELTR